MVALNAIVIGLEVDKAETPHTGKHFVDERDIYWYLGQTFLIAFITEIAIRFNILGVR